MPPPSPTGPGQEAPHLPGTQQGQGVTAINKGAGCLSRKVAEESTQQAHYREEEGATVSVAHGTALAVEFLGAAPLLWGGAAARGTGGAHPLAGMALVHALPPPAHGLVNHLQAKRRQQAQVPGVGPGQGVVGRDMPGTTLLLHSLVEGAVLLAVGCPPWFLGFGSMAPQLLLGQVDGGDVPREASAALG